MSDTEARRTMINPDILPEDAWKNTTSTSTQQIGKLSHLVDLQEPYQNMDFPRLHSLDKGHWKQATWPRPLDGFRLVLQST